MTELILIAFASTLILSLALTPVAKKIAKQVGAIDLPDGRKVHKEPITRFGGLAVFVSLAVALFGVAYFFPGIFSRILPENMPFLSQAYQPVLIIGAFLLVFVVGVWDDIKSLSPGPKFLAQFIGASMIYLAGFEISTVSLLKDASTINLHFIAYPITIFWIIGITNAFNLIDGLDGLASGVAAIALGTIGSIAFIQNQFGIVIICALLIGAILGFLWYNFRPATIFLGDSGSLFLGFTLSVLSISSLTKVSTTFTVFVPIIVLGLPIVDTLLSMVRRFFSWFVPTRRRSQKNLTFKKVLRSIFQPDKSHIHHQLLQYGLSHRNTVLVLYAVSLFFGFGAFIIVYTGQTSTTFFVILAIIGLIKLGVSKLKYNEIDLMHNGIFYTMYSSLVLNKRHFRKVFDAVFVILSFSAAAYIVSPEQTTRVFASFDNSSMLFVTIFGVQILCLWLTGLYRETIRQLGIADAFKIIKSIFIATVVSSVIHYFFLSRLISFDYLLYLLDFYFLVTTILGIRVSFHLLRYLFNKSRPDTKKVLIYGAKDQGVIALQRMLVQNKIPYTPVGFLDEDPALEGRLVNGLSVYGGHWKLDRILKTKNVDELHITDSSVPEEVLQRIYKTSRKHNLQLRFFDVQLQEIDAFYEDSTSAIPEKLHYAE